MLFANPIYFICFLRVAMHPDRKRHFPISFAIKLVLNLVLTNKIRREPKGILGKLFKEVEVASISLCLSSVSCLNMGTMFKMKWPFWKTLCWLNAVCVKMSFPETKGHFYFSLFHCQLEVSCWGPKVASLPSDCTLW